jgi:hypothetical protein
VNPSFCQNMSIAEKELLKKTFTKFYIIWFELFFYSHSEEKFFNSETITPNKAILQLEKNIYSITLLVKIKFNYLLFIIHINFCQNKMRIKNNYRLYSKLLSNLF